jgi:large subunit ribosomal protein L15
MVPDTDFLMPMTLTDIAPVPGAHYVAKRRGRGIGSGKGKTCGRGQKGQGSRTGVAINQFEGGQTPLYTRLPKRGFKPLRKDTATVSLPNLAFYVNNIISGELVDITKEWLRQHGFMTDRELRVKFFGDPNLFASHVNIRFSFGVFSAAARSHFETKGYLAAGL